MIPSGYSADNYGRADAAKYTEDATIRAHVQERQIGDESVRAGRDEPLQRVVLTIRKRDNVTPSSRFKWRGKTLRVINVASPGSMRRRQIVECAYAGD